jgi:hypothetical protein
VNTHRMAAIVTGVLFIVGTAAGIAAKVMVGPFLDSPDYLVKLAANEGQVTIAALLIFIMGAAAAGMGVSMYPVLRRYDEGLALGSAGFRIMEGVLDIVGVVILVSLLALSQAFANAGAPTAPDFQIIGVALQAGHGWVNGVAAILCWDIGALMYYSVFYRSGLIPRWLSVWGLVGIGLSIAASLLTVFRVLDSSSTVFILLQAPVGLQEMVFAVWLIVKGYDPSAVVPGADGSARHSATSLSRLAMLEPDAPAKAPVL